jgi:NADH-quinone oxidoreductase subunit N
LIGLAFKISAVPFHFWAPDVYEGSPTTITAFMATVVKISGVAALYNVLSLFVSVSPTWMNVLLLLTILTLIIPNIAAVLQNSAKRMLAYSSVGHVGFILMALTVLYGSGCTDCSASESGKVIVYYLAAYSVASLLGFNAIAIVEKHIGHVSIANFKGLFKKNSFLAVSMTVALLSLAGIPPLAGFFGKYLVFVLAIERGFILLALLGVLASLIGVYYYFRILVAMYFQEPHGEGFSLEPHQKVWMVIMIILSVGLGVFADFFLQ